MKVVDFIITKIVLLFVRAEHYTEVEPDVTTKITYKKFKGEIYITRVQQWET
jgi:hypothetical protein